MIPRLGPDAALLLIDVQQGVHDLDHWSPGGAMNDPEACVANLRALLGAARAAGLAVAFSRHDSVEPDSPLKLALPSGRQIEGLEPAPGDVVVDKDVNSAFLGTPLEIRLRRAGIGRLVVAGYFTNFCVETSVRMAGNMGFDVLLAHDACATADRRGHDGRVWPAADVHALSVASMHGEFCTAIATADALSLMGRDRPDLRRAQGNEASSARPAERVA